MLRQQLPFSHTIMGCLLRKDDYILVKHAAPSPVRFSTTAKKALPRNFETQISFAEIKKEPKIHTNGIGRVGLVRISIFD